MYRLYILVPAVITAIFAGSLCYTASQSIKASMSKAHIAMAAAAEQTEQGGY